MSNLKFLQIYDPKYYDGLKSRKITMVLNNQTFEMIVPKDLSRYAAVAIDFDGEVTLYEELPKLAAENWYNAAGTGWITIGRLEKSDGSFVEFDQFEYLTLPVSKRINFDKG